MAVLVCSSYSLLLDICRPRLRRRSTSCRTPRALIPLSPFQSPSSRTTNRHRLWHKMILTFSNAFKHRGSVPRTIHLKQDVRAGQTSWLHIEYNHSPMSPCLCISPFKAPSCRMCALSEHHCFQLLQKTEAFDFGTRARIGPQRLCTP